MKKFVPGAFLAVLIATVIALPITLSAKDQPVTDIRRVLDDQVAAWNRGDLEGYMRGYWHSSELTFFSGGTVTSGWEPTLARYQKRYQGEGHEMGRLDFSDLSVEMLGDKAAFIRGRWHLKMTDGKEPKGLFTLIMRRTPEGWRIIHDHTSVE